MSITPDDTFDIDQAGMGLVDGDGNQILYLTVFSGDPTGSVAPINTWVFRSDDQTIWYKFGAGNNDWEQSAFKITDFIAVSTGVADADKPIKTDAGGQVDGSLVNEANDEFTVVDTADSTRNVRVLTNNGFGGFGIDKPNSLSGFMNFMPNAPTPQIIFGNPASANGVNRLFLDVDMQGEMFLNVLGGAGANADVIATSGAALRPNVDLTSTLGSVANRWGEIRATGIRYDVAQTGHGLTLPSYGVLPVYYNNTSGIYELANANDTTTAADALVVALPDADTITIQEQGFVYGAHGLDVGKWYVLEAGIAGQLVALDTLLGTGLNVQFCVFVVDANTLLLRLDPIFTEDLFVPEDISILEEWTNGAQPVTISDGVNRLLLVQVSWEDQAGSTLVTSMEVGGEVGNLVTEQSIISGLQYGASLCYWTDAQIENMVGTTLTINWSAGAPDFFINSAALLQGVDQTTPIVDTNTDQGTGGTDTLDADVDTVDGGYAVLIAGGGNPGMGFTNNGTGWTNKLDLDTASSDGILDDKLIASDATPENVNVSITGSNRHILIAGSFRRQE